MCCDVYRTKAMPSLNCRKPRVYNMTEWRMQQSQERQFNLNSPNFTDTHTLLHFIHNNSGGEKEAERGRERRLAGGDDH